MYSQRINEAKKKTEVLYRELVKKQSQARDSSFLEITSSAIPPLSNHSLKLKPCVNLKGHFDKVVDMTWSSDSASILSLSRDGFMVIWDPLSGYKKYAIALQNEYALTCTYSSNNKFVASAGLDNACTIYQLHSDNSAYIKSILKGHSAYISDCIFQNNDKIITASGDMTCSLWDCNRALKVRDYISHVGDVLCLSENENCNPNCFVSGSADGTVKVWDTRQLREAQSFAVSKSDINCLSMFPGGNAVCTGSDDGVVRFFDFRSDCKLAEYSLSQQIEQSLYSKPQSPYRENAPTLFRNNSSDAISTGGGESYRNIYSNLYTPGVNSIDFSRSGRLIFACYSNYGCIVWDTLLGEAVGSLSSHNSKVSKVAVSGDGFGVATASWDSNIKIWSV